MVLRRLLTLGRTSPAFYRATREEYLRAYEDAAAQRGGFLTHYRRVLRDNGVFYTSLVLDAYRADVVTPTEVSGFWGVSSFDTFPRYKKRLRPGLTSVLN